MIAFRVLLLATLLSAVTLAQDVPEQLFAPEIPSPTVANDAAAVPAPMPAPLESGTVAGNIDFQSTDSYFPPPPSSIPIPQPQTAYSPGLPHDSYFLASSRCSIQNIRSYERWGLDVYQRVGNGPLQPSNMPLLTAQLTPGLPVCIYVHGSFVQWDSQCREAHEAHQVFRSICPGQPLQMIFYTWPSDGPYTYLPPIDVTVRGEQAEFNGFHLAWIISQIPESCPICLISHSHGARAILAATHLAGGGTVQGHYFTGNMGARRYRVVLAAAAMDHHWLNPGQRYECALNRVECLLNLRNRNDLPLLFYPLTRPFAHRALARSGFTRIDRWRQGSSTAKIQELDISALVGHHHYWPHYYCDPTIAAAIKSYMVFGY